MKEDIKKVIDNLSGNIVLCGITDYDVYKRIDKNNKIKEIYNLEKKYKINRQEQINGIKSIKLKKIKKELKNNLDYLLCDVNGINTYLRQVVHNTYDTFNKQIILYGILDEYDVDRLIYKYKRYYKKIDKKIFGDSFILIIDTNSESISSFKKGFNNFIDDIRDIFDAIGTILMQ